MRGDTVAMDCTRRVEGAALPGVMPFVALDACKALVAAPVKPLRA